MHVIACNDHVIACKVPACNGHVMQVIACNNILGVLLISGRLCTICLGFGTLKYCNISTFKFLVQAL
jgi:hypothetical protein